MLKIYYKKNQALIKVFGEKRSRTMLKKKVAMISRLCFEMNILTSIAFINNGEWSDVHGVATVSEFEELVGIIANESQKDDYKRINIVIIKIHHKDRIKDFWTSIQIDFFKFIERLSLMCSQNRYGI